MADPNLQGALVGAGILQKLQETVPDLAPLFTAVPELRDLFIKILPPPSGEGWTTEKFANELHKTNWWKTTPEAARLWIALSVSDPAQAGRQRQSTVNSYYDIAGQLGVSVPVPNMALLAEAGLRQGWGENEIRRAILDQAHLKDPHTGGLDSQASQLRATAADYGVPMGDQALFDEAKKIAGGRGTQEGFVEQMRQHAKSLYPVLADAIDNGTTVRQYAEPYAQVAAQYLDLNPAQFDLTDPKWSAALQQRDPTTSKLHPLTLADWKSKIMTDKQYGFDNSQMAQKQALDFNQSLSEQFGFRA